MDDVQCFHSRDQQLRKVIGSKERFSIRTRFNSSCFLHTHMADVTQRENALYAK